MDEELENQEVLDNQIVLTFIDGTAYYLMYTVELSINGGENKLIMDTNGKTREILEITNILYKGY